MVELDDILWSKWLYLCINVLCHGECSGKGKQTETIGRLSEGLLIMEDNRISILEVL